MIVGGFCSDHFNSTKFIASAPYLLDDLTWCVSRAKPKPRWKNLFYIIKDAQTFTFGVVLFIWTTFAGYLLTTFEEKPLDLIYSFLLTSQTMASLPMNYRPMGSLIRIHYAQFLIFPYWLTQIYCAFSFIFVTRVIYDNQINTIDEIASNTFDLAGDPYALGFLNNSNMVRFEFNLKTLQKLKTFLCSVFR